MYLSEYLKDSFIYLKHQTYLILYLSFIERRKTIFEFFNPNFHFGSITISESETTKHHLNLKPSFETAQYATSCQ